MLDELLHMKGEVEQCSFWPRFYEDVVQVIIQMMPPGRRPHIVFHLRLDLVKMQVLTLN